MGQVFPVDLPGRVAASFGVDANRIGIRKIELDNAREAEQIELGAITFFWAYRASGLNANMQVSFERPGPANRITIEAGFAIDVKATQLWLTNTAQASEWIEIIYLVEDGTGTGFNFTNPQKVLQNVKIDITDSGLVSTTDDSVAATTTEVVLAANASRRKAILANPFGNAREFRIGDSNAGAARGIELPPGARIELETTGAIYAYNPDAAAMVISLLEISE